MILINTKINKDHLKACEELLDLNQPVRKFVQ